MVLCHNKFIPALMNDLFCDWRIIPTYDMDTGQQLNCLIRLLFLFFIFYIILNKNNNVIVPFFILFNIIILYIIKGNTMSRQHKENFTYNEANTDFYSNENNGTNMPEYQSQVNYKPSHEQKYFTDFHRAKTDNQGDIIQDVNYTPFAYDAVELQVNDPEYVSNNYKIVGGPNPKTLVRPVIVPRIADLSYWKSNNLITHSAINANKNIDVFQSGYEVSNFCGDNSCPKTNNNFDYIKLNSNYKKVHEPKHQLDTSRNSRYHQKYAEHQRNTHKHMQDEIQQPYYDMRYNDLKENFTLEEFIKKKSLNKTPIENIGLVNKTCGYDADQFETAGVPVNLNLGKCQTTSDLKDYNEKLFTQIIQPGVYTVNQVNEPINSNIGISFDQQFEPLSYNANEFGGVTFTEHDPLDPTLNPKDNILKYNDNGVIEPVTQSNVYDPRFSGYGTSYRAYTDKNVGQTRFFYDDINSIRMPNYVVRSKIDFADFADTYDPMSTQYGNANNSNIRALANQKFLDDALEFRTGMQERLLRKRNSELWQTRVAPIRTGNQRMLGGQRGGW